MTFYSNKRRCSSNASDSPIGATVRGNIMEIFEQRNITPKDFYDSIGMLQDTFYGQFRANKNGPRLVVLQKFADELELPIWRLLLDYYTEEQAEAEVKKLVGLRDKLRPADYRRHGTKYIKPVDEHVEGRNFRVYSNIIAFVKQDDRTLQDVLAEQRIEMWCIVMSFRRNGPTMVNLESIADELEVSLWALVA